MNDEYAHNNLGNLIEPDTLVSHEYSKTQLRTLPADPEQVLLLAVLKDAVETFQRLFGAKTTAGRRLFRESEEWIWSDESDRVFSFVHICDALGLDPRYIRRGLRNWAFNHEQEANPPAWDKIGATAAPAASAVRAFGRQSAGKPLAARNRALEPRAKSSLVQSRRRTGGKASGARFRRAASAAQSSKRA
jgi:hypothetical protein